jgi:hypothetical protein
MRRRAKTDVIPEKLRSYVVARWIQDAVDHDDSFLSPRLRALTPAELQEDWYALKVLAPARYRQALVDAVGRGLGDRHYYKVQGGTAPARAARVVESEDPRPDWPGIL